MTVRYKNPGSDSHENAEGKMDKPAGEFTLRHQAAMGTVSYQTGLRSQPAQPVANFPTPVQLDGRVYRYLSGKAEGKGMQVDDLVNELLKKAIELSWRLDSSC
jgi:hypothetical protein